VEKSTVQAGSHNAVSSGMPSGGMSATPATDVQLTAIDDVGCEACQ
jgi:ribonucleoside-diphosphate reductase alpha chain